MKTGTRGLHVAVTEMMSRSDAPQSLFVATLRYDNFHTTGIVDSLAYTGASEASATAGVFNLLHQHTFSRPISPIRDRNTHDYTDAESFRLACKKGYEGTEVMSTARLLWEVLGAAEKTLTIAGYDRRR